MPLKGWIVRHAGHEIRVLNTWLFGAKLYVDDVCVCENRGLFSVTTNRPLLTAAIEVAGKSQAIEVFIVSILTTKAAIFVDGVQVGGDVIHIGDDIKRFRADHRRGALGNEGSAVAVPSRLLPAGDKD
jgi:hypothetical protein